MTLVNVTVKRTGFWYNFTYDGISLTMDELIAYAQANGLSMAVEGPFAAYGGGFSVKDIGMDMVEVDIAGLGWAFLEVRSM
ncbi:hypothetical protein LPJ61_006972 [Coemansia biformis]|uniref:Uncharacterized protein n=1 Tax=Coemansia biformis TaxID=1286918 RepID=A0A9W7XP34_9FUNG|nr:hypothetical protein LPJ61_006972 [Coemansia biformis]